MVCPNKGHLGTSKNKPFNQSLRNYPIVGGCNLVFFFKATFFFYCSFERGPTKYSSYVEFLPSWLCIFCRAFSKSIPRSFSLTFEPSTLSVKVASDSLNV